MMGGAANGWCKQDKGIHNMWHGQGMVCAAGVSVDEGMACGPGQLQMGLDMCRSGGGQPDMMEVVQDW